VPRNHDETPQSPADPTTRVAVLTPDGRGAIAAVRLWGPDAVPIASRVFRPTQGPKLDATPPGVVRFGRAGDGPGEEVVAVVTADDPPEVEVHGHGGPVAVRRLVAAFVAAGAEERRPVAWVRRAARSAIEAEAVVDLARAPTLRAAEILLEQANGALADAVSGILKRLDGPTEGALEALEALVSLGAVGLRLTAGWKVVLSGRPNVGKSRLLNALAGYERAIVDPTPGTTRDVLTLATAVDGWPVELTDTAGRRLGGDAIEREGIGRARDTQRAADLTLLVLDRSEPLGETDQALISECPGALLVANKSDLPAAWGEADVPASVVVVSAEHGDGVAGLAGEIARRLVPSPPPPGAGLPFRPRHLRALNRGADALRAGEVSAARRTLVEFLASAGD